MEKQKRRMRTPYFVYGNIEGAQPQRPELPGRFCEVICFRANIAQFTLNGNICTAYKNDFLLLSPADEFEAASTDVFGVKISNELLLWISTDFTDFTQLFAEVRKPENFGAVFADKAAAMLRRANELREPEKFGDDTLSIAEIARLLIELYRSRKKEGKSKSRRSAWRPGGTVTARSVMNYIDMNYTDPQLDLNKIATAMFFSASRLSHIFKNETGDSIYHYLTNKRLRCAHDLIAQGYSVMDACSRSGFRSYCSFYRMYLKHYGFAPMNTNPEQPDKK